MNLLIDGQIFEVQKWGGISRVYTEILPRISRLAPDISIQIGLIEEPLGTEQFKPLEPFAWRIAGLPNLKPWKLWRHLKAPLNRFVKLARCNIRDTDVFHPSCLRCSNRHAPMFCFAHDLIVCKTVLSDTNTLPQE